RLAESSRASLNGLAAHDASPSQRPCRQRRMGMSTGNATERLAEWVAQAQFEDLPRRVTEEAKSQILSVIASVHAGHFSDAGRIVTRTVKEWSGGKEATLIPSGERTSVHYAVFGNSALSM